MSALAKINIGLKQLGIDEDDKRDLYCRVTGERSLRDMSPDQHRAVLDELGRLGFKPVSKGARKGLEGKYAGKLQALWIAGWNLGLVRNRDDAALFAFVKRQTGIDHTRFLRFHEDAKGAIEALKAWLERDGGVDWSKDRFLPDWTQANGYRIAKAQLMKLVSMNGLVVTQGFMVDEKHRALERWLIEHGYRAPALMTDGSWIEAMNTLGRMIRDAQKAGA